MIDVFYSCRRCGTDSRAVTVAERATDTSLLAWLQDDVMPFVKRDHATRSPKCDAALVRLLLPGLGHLTQERLTP